MVQISNRKMYLKLTKVLFVLQMFLFYNNRKTLQFVKKKCEKRKHFRLYNSQI